MRHLWWLLILVLAMSACGGSVDDGVPDADAGANELTVFGSDDGVVTVQVPAGAAPDGFEGSVSLSDPSTLGVDTSDLEGVILVYELGPDGTEFDEPVIVTFRISAALGGFDPTMGLPLSLLVIDDGAGGFEPMASMNMSLDGGTLVLEGTTTHFTEATAYVPGGGSIELVVEPPGLEKSVESLFNALIDQQGYWEAVNRIDYSVEGDLEIFSEQDQEATIECVREGEGKIHATVFGNAFELGGGWEVIFDRFTGGTAEFIGRVSLTIKCVEDTATDTPETEVPPGLDPRAHIVSVEPYVTEDGTHGFMVGFSQGWDGLPVLYSFFVELVFTSGECSMTAGHETHAGTDMPLGPGAKYLLDDGRFAADTGCPYDPDNVFEVTGRSGSQADSDSQATFDTFVESDVPTADATTVDPSRVVVVIDEGTPEHLKVAQPTGASNDGEKITITFAGDVKALVDGGAYKVTINAQATDGGIRVTVTLRSTNGELLLNGATFDDADAVGGSIDGKNVETTWEWSGGNEVVIDIVSPDGVAIPSTPPRISVKVQETESSDEIELNFQ